jgi:acyl-CoA thioesterase I
VGKCATAQAGGSRSLLAWKSPGDQDGVQIQSRLGARGVRVIMMENGMFRGLPERADGRHMTPDGYRMLAEALAGQVEAALGR